MAQLDHPAVAPVGGDAPPDAVVCRLIAGCTGSSRWAGSTRVGLVPPPSDEHGKVVVHMVGQASVAQDHAPLQDALAVKNRVPGLSHQGLQRRAWPARKVVRRSGKPAERAGET